MHALQQADKRKKPSPDNLFTDVYDNMPKRLHQQYEEMKCQMEIYPDKYPLEAHESIQDV